MARISGEIPKKLEHSCLEITAWAEWRYGNETQFIGLIFLGPSNVPGERIISRNMTC